MNEEYSACYVYLKDGILEYWCCLNDEVFSDDILSFEDENCSIKGLCVYEGFGMGIKIELLRSLYAL